MSDEKNPKDYRIVMPDGLRDAFIAEHGHKALATILTEMQTTVAAGGIDALLAESRKCIVAPEDACCQVCGATLKQDEQWLDERFCNRTPACERYVYYLPGGLEA